VGRLGTGRPGHSHILPQFLAEEQSYGSGRPTSACLHWSGVQLGGFLPSLQAKEYTSGNDLQPSFPTTTIEAHPPRDPTSLILAVQLKEKVTHGGYGALPSARGNGEVPLQRRSAQPNASSEGNLRYPSSIKWRDPKIASPVAPESQARRPFTPLLREHGLRVGCGFYSHTSASAPGNKPANPLSQTKPAV
jgi:hypothetical protein